MIKPWLLLPAKWAHDLAPLSLKLISSICKTSNTEYSPFHWKGVCFKNPLGIAGGVDKNAELAKSFQALGAGFIEVGTVTPMPQGPNPGVIIKRDTKHKALWNKMGFPSKGLSYVQKQLQKNSSQINIPLLINIGKNRHTENNKAHLDYIKCMQELYPWASAFVINISSPNTKGLRELLSPNHLKSFLQPIIDANKTWHKPLILKLSPDITDEQLKEVLQTSCELGIDGFILTNTTQGARKGLNFPVEGGVSGAPLANQSLHLLKQAHQFLSQKQPSALLISAGGIFSAKDIKMRRDAGANLVQVYSALVFEGPMFFKKSIDRLKSLS